jgi:nitric oxide reductase NorD protein
LDPEVLALPQRLARYPDAELNRALYRWLAALASQLDPEQGWLQGNLAATRRVLATFPGLAASWEQLRAAELALRRPAPESAAEAQLRAALLSGEAEGELDPVLLAPLWCWLRPMPAGTPVAQALEPEADRPRAPANPGAAPPRAAPGRAAGQPRAPAAGRQDRVAEDLCRPLPDRPRAG